MNKTIEPTIIRTTLKNEKDTIVLEYEYNTDVLNGTIRMHVEGQGHRMTKTDNNVTVGMFYNVRNRLIACGLKEIEEE